jgi:3-isopropylmalate/(R)-2-methylmalate dehydratase large subunit
MISSQTLVEKIWNNHRILSNEGMDLLFIDRHFVHEGSHHAFHKISASGREVRHPRLTFGVADHYAPTGVGKPDEAMSVMISRLRENTAQHRIDSFDLSDARHGIVHVTMPEQGLSLPGTTIVCGDSHTATHGAFGAFAFGIGASEVAHVLATQTLWQKPVEPMRITINGRLPFGTSAKDLALYVIAQIGTGGAAGYSVEYAGDTVAGLSIEGRMTLCNMTIEMGARSGIIPPDDITFAWLKGRALAPVGADWDTAVAQWRDLKSDRDATFKKDLTIEASNVVPMVTWGTAPDQVAAVTACVPSDGADDAALRYMGLTAGQAITAMPIDQAFIGSCTNGRYSDLLEASRVLLDNQVKVPLLISPGSAEVARQAEANGLVDIFIQSGATWARSGCSLCVGMNGDRVKPGQRCASTSNRNFKGRQGKGSRTHLMSPAMVAAAAVAGCIVDVRQHAGYRRSGSVPR